MKKFFIIILLIILPNNDSKAAIYTKCFIERITHPTLKAFERKSFSQMKGFATTSDFFPGGAVVDSDFSFGNLQVDNDIIQYYIPGVNKILSDKKIKNFNKIKFELTEDNFFSSNFYVDYDEWTGLPRKNLAKSKPNVANNNAQKIFINRYKVINNSNEFIEYESEDPRWNTKLILHKKDDIIEIQTKILFFDVDYKEDSINADFIELTLNDFKDKSNEFDYSKLKLVEPNIRLDSASKAKSDASLYPGDFSIFFKCKFKPFKENEKENFFNFNNIYTLLIAGFLSLLSIILIFWKFFLRK